MYEFDLGNRHMNQSKHKLMRTLPGTQTYDISRGEGAGMRRIYLMGIERYRVSQ